MEAGGRDHRRGLIIGEHLQSFAAPSTLTLRVPARPEALGIVRLVVMSCGAAAGVALEDIFSRSHEAAEAFANVLIAHPEATSVVIRTDPGTGDVDILPVRETEVRPGG